MKFQALFAAVTALIMFYFLILTRKSALRRLFALFIFGTGLVFILYPGLAMRIAHVVGIGRGADLVFYVSILFLCFLSFNFYIRFQTVDDRLTRIVRLIALQHPVLEDANVPGGRAARRADPAAPRAAAATPDEAESIHS